MIKIFDFCIVSRGAQNVKIVRYFKFLAERCEIM